MQPLGGIDETRERFFDDAARIILDHQHSAPRHAQGFAHYRTRVGVVVQDKHQHCQIELVVLKGQLFSVIHSHRQLARVIIHHVEQGKIRARCVVQALGDQTVPRADFDDMLVRL